MANTTLARNPKRTYNRNQRKRLAQRQNIRALQSRFVTPVRRGAVPKELTWVGTKTFAKHIGKSQTFVKEHAEDFGARKNKRGHWEFPLEEGHDE